MFIIRVDTSGTLDTSWMLKLGGNTNTIPSGISFYGGYIYVTGSADNSGWTIAGTDMFFMRLQDTMLANASPNYLKTLGGTQADEGKKIFALSDGYVYALGQGYSTELTNAQSLDIFLVRYPWDASTISYFKHFGGRD